MASIASNRLYVLTSWCMASEHKTQTKRQTTSRAVKTLRNRLGWSQPKLARAVSEDLDGGSISRWERGILGPQPANRRALEQLAEKHGYHDLAAAFGDPLAEWKTIVFSAADRHLLALFEIILLNREEAHDDGSVIPGKQFQEVMDAVLAAVKTLKRAHAAGKRIDMVGDEQAAAWLEVIGGVPKKRARKSSGRAGGKKVRASDIVEAALGRSTRDARKRNIEKE